VDIRELRNSFDYRFRPRSGPVTSWGPGVFTDNVWAHDGTRLDTYYSPGLAIGFKGQSYLSFTPYTEFRERLRPSDFPALTQNQDFHEHNSTVNFGTSYLSKLTVQGYYQWGDGVNFLPPVSQAPFLSSADTANVLVSFLPVTALKIDNTYLFNRLRDRASGEAIFNNHILRSKWNWQYNRALSFRLILQYNATLANQAFTSLQTTKQFNADFLVTYLLHPGTAIYVGYNSDLQNMAFARFGDFVGVNRTRSAYMNDSRQFFVKVSYLFRL
jgi:hypothetical protein